MIRRKIKNFIFMKKLFAIVFFLLGIGVNLSLAQVGILRGGSAVLSSSSKSITINVPSSGLSNYTLSLASAQSNSDSTRWLCNDGSGNLSWSAQPGGLTGNGVTFTPGAPQQTATSPNYLFYIQNLHSSSNTNSPGAFVAASVVDGTGSSATG